MRNIFISMLATVFITACSSNGNKFDASGTFEATEVIVSSELSGKILSLTVNEGDTVSASRVVGTVDAEGIELQKEQVEASISSLNDKTADVGPQVALLQNQLAVQQSQLNNLLHEKQRIENLIKQDAATGKQLDDINAQIDVVRKQMGVTQQQINVQRNNTSTQNKSILSESKPLQKRVEQLNDQLKRADIVNPINGTVLTKYAEAGELTSTGKALYKIADLGAMKLRAYVTGDQLSQIKLGQQVKVLVDDGKDKYKELVGTISWISDKAEFTPKTIQTKEERANLVYAVKINVKNDGYLKIGMYGEVVFK
ncbi:HlyD family secretion protein [Lacibacter sediminis]|uniref:HlyD family efflux transporter periplasmic adaptor subunit n=1 Tax=Lacibacter sediminis TaxID=2760713 RepID=A0A7G5XJ26_9BACT|nr:HlyD family efflux transporter periplasmic adaptor subunit [Lacibacter sediminis]QNA45479.1 HlyD family efflux transporter periplasmic adaptor subunit [Lacibacter sediminis]